MKRSVYTAPVVATLFASLAAGPLAGSALAQVVNPLQAAKDALNKAKTQLQAQTASTPSATPTSGQPASQPAAQGLPQGPQAASGSQQAVPGALSSNLLTPAPPGGLDPSKLPDLLGLHIGEPTDRAVAEIQKLYPVIRNDHGTVIWGKLTPYTTKYAFTNDPPYISAEAVAKPNTAGCSPINCQAQDVLNAVFSGPPGRRLVQLKRSLTWDMEKVPTTDTLRNALIQKYGQNFIENSALTLTWLFDETGAPMPPLDKAVAATGCQGIVSSQGGGAAPVRSYLVGMPSRTQQDLDRIVKVRCGMQVQVVAWIGGTRGGTANSLDVTIREIAADLRDAFAAENYLRQAANAEGNKQLNSAQQQAAPKF